LLLITNARKSRLPGVFTYGKSNYLVYSHQGVVLDTGKPFNKVLRAFLNVYRDNHLRKIINASVYYFVY
jgi:hypothetical protein